MSDIQEKKGSKGEIKEDKDRKIEQSLPAEVGSSDGGRRNFLKGAMAVSIAALVAAIAAIFKSVNSPAYNKPTSGQTGVSESTVKFPRIKVANIKDLKENQPITFNYPLDTTPNLVVKLGQKAQGGVGPNSDIVAFSQICQHLGCIYGFQAIGSSPSCNSSYKAERPVGYCCCHGGVYDYLNGAKVIGGPPPRGQPPVSLEYDNSTGDIYAVGMGPPNIFGHGPPGTTDPADVLKYDLQGGTIVS